jgi:Predicted transcriptional regulators
VEKDLKSEIERVRRVRSFSLEDNIIADRLFELRKDSGKTQQDIADVLETDRRVINSYERKTVKPPLVKLIKLAKAYNVSMDYLCGLSDEKKPPHTDDNVNYGLTDESKRKLLYILQTDSTLSGIYAINKMLEFCSESLFHDIGIYLRKLPINGVEFLGTGIDRTRYSDDIKERLAEEYILIEEFKNLFRLIQSSNKILNKQETLADRIKKDNK